MRCADSDPSSPHASHLPGVVADIVQQQSVIELL